MVEALADSFDPARVETYEAVMSEWGLRRAAGLPRIPERVESVYVLSRVTLGADIKIVSIVLDAMKRRFPQARIVFAANRKSAELFEADNRLAVLEVNYPRTGAVSERIAFGQALRSKLRGERRIVIDPDSRMTQLGLVPVCEPENYFHFPSRSFGGTSLDNLSELTNRWLEEKFGLRGNAYVAPKPVAIDCARPAAAVSLGVGENETKRIGGDFEAKLIAALTERYRTVWLDRGAGGEEARRVTAAVAGRRVRFWEGSFAGFVSVVAQSDFYVGYDSAGQHAAAAAGVPLVSIFAGAVSDVFRARWAPHGAGIQTVLNADILTPAEILGDRHLKPG